METISIKTWYRRKLAKLWLVIVAASLIIESVVIRKLSEPRY